MFFKSIANFPFARYYSLACGNISDPSVSVHSSPDRMVWVRALAENIVLGSSVRNFYLTVPLYIQMYKWAPANLMLEVTLRGVEIILAASYSR